MKNKISAIFCAVLWILSSGVQAEGFDGFTISGKVTGFNDGDRLLLMDETNGGNFVAESKVEVGEFQFSGQVDEPIKNGVVIKSMSGYTSEQFKEVERLISE